MQFDVENITDYISNVNNYGVWTIYKIKDYDVGMATETDKQLTDVEKCKAWIKSRVTEDKNAGEVTLIHGIPSIDAIDEMLNESKIKLPIPNTTIKIQGP